MPRNRSFKVSRDDPELMMPSPQKHQQQQKQSKSLDLAIVDQAFGEFADLYSDVLRVSVSSSHEQIQLAYFDRRSELFTLLAKIDARDSKPSEKTVAERAAAERKMDSVVLAVRILGDPHSRKQYDKLRQERLLNRRRAAAEGSARSNGTARMSQHTSRTSAAVEATSKKDRKAPKLNVVSRGEVEEISTATSLETDGDYSKDSPRAVDEFRDDDRTMDDTATYSDGSKDVQPKSGVLSCFSNSRVLKTISDEISGAYEDTLVSVDQVFNVFTLTDKDIRAVTKKIDKAKKQLET